mgnify:CR=1 FL=1
MHSCAAFVKVNEDGRQLHGLRLVELDTCSDAPPWLETRTGAGEAFYASWTFRQLLHHADADPTINLADFDAEARGFPSREFLL